jgi:hypothetical protein
VEEPREVAATTQCVEMVLVIVTQEMQVVEVITLSSVSLEKPYSYIVNNVYRFSLWRLVF